MKLEKYRTFDPILFPDSLMSLLSQPSGAILTTLWSRHTSTRPILDPSLVINSSNYYNGSVADVHVLVDSFQFLGLSLALCFGVMHVAAVWFLLQSRKTYDNGNASTLRPSAFVLASACSIVFACMKLADSGFQQARRARERCLTTLRGPSSVPSVSVKVGFLQSTSNVAEEEEDGNHGLRHLAVIMDGNRRYGKRLTSELKKEEGTDISSSLASNIGIVGDKYSSSVSSSGSVVRSLAASPLNGHRAGGEKLMSFIRYCIKHHISMLTVYAFSTENWTRSKDEIDVLMFLFEHFFERIRASAHSDGIFIRFIATEPDMLPTHILRLMEVVENETRQVTPRRIVVNCCVSYGGRSEIVRACRRLAEQNAAPDAINEESISSEMLRSITQADHAMEDEHVLVDNGGSEPQVLLRTSGEARISNFLMWESAYTEFVFVEKSWPEMEEVDVANVIGEYRRRNRRFGK